MPKAPTKVVALATIDSLVQQYQELKDQEKVIADRKKRLADEIKAYADACGVQDDKGSIYCENDSFFFGKQCKKSISFSAKAVEFLKNAGLNNCIKVVETVNDDEVEKAVTQGKLTLEELESITETKTTYAIDVRPKSKVVDTVEETTVLSASTKKKPPLRKK
jgi:hypothetical protein